ncbi:hypothetical protein TVNIR_0510 [Thioalkalivibrio nitratireducens DSM 14787]|uniref:Uncharacterized protein n=1 Tax=Thioalkalivibrio nitratireducens (strain DSM 14787 / UNIQEM 213 / ALEN2) TaxID=1255043 RepID=L0DT94_THIND|nr:hypothetical protein TVNIR_0510 [Thioalkalivibrio nitratireducens DSM 14787]
MPAQSLVLLGHTPIRRHGLVRSGTIPYDPQILRQAGIEPEDFLQ